MYPCCCMALNVRIWVSLELIYLIKTEYYSQFQLRIMYYNSSHLGPLCRRPIEKSYSSVFCPGFFLFPLSIPFFLCLPQGWNPWVGMCRWILNNFFVWVKSCLKLKVKNYFVYNFVWVIFSIFSPFRPWSTGLRPNLVNYHFSPVRCFITII